MGRNVQNLGMDPGSRSQESGFPKVELDRSALRTRRIEVNARDSVLIGGLEASDRKPIAEVASGNLQGRGVPSIELPKGYAGILVSLREFVGSA